MKDFLKRAAKRMASAAVAASDRTVPGRYLYEQVVRNSMSRTQQVTHRNTRIVLAIPNALCKFRADSFSTKEPETLEWIDLIPRGSTVWDIGANVGLYTCYAAKARDCRVFAFEPSVFNLELLARNVFLNELALQVTVVPLPLSEQLLLSTLRMTATEWGGALSTFGESYGHDGNPINKVFEFPTIGMSMEDAISLLHIPQPDFIKMDVDGIEHLILKGGTSVLRRIQGISIEINDEFAAQANDSSGYLREAGLRLKDKRHAAYLDSHSGAARSTFNQVWVR